jgi:GTPase SAR1 family protein
VTQTPSAYGYETARETSDAVARALWDIAVLVGEPSSDPVRLQSGVVEAPGLGFGEDATALRIRARDLSQGLFKIIVLGEFKNGKSTLLNSMLGSKTLPAKAAPATAIITLLVYGDAPDVAVYETGKAEPRMVSWERFVQEFQLSRQDQETLAERGTADRFAHVEYAQIERRHPICAHGVKLIDSPGLGEHISRTRVATNFLKQSQAVIMVLNATRILTQDERAFIDTVLGEERLEHVFFVVNRVNQIDEKAVGEIKTWVEDRLAHHFLDANGELDHDLYSRRVFFLNAKGALEARSDLPHDEARLEASGVPALERELERFLTGGEKIAAALQSTIQLLRPLSAQARRRVDEAGAALDQPLAELERRRAEAEGRLQGLEARRREIERTILLFGETIAKKVYADLRRYVDEMHEAWNEDSRQLMDLDSAISIKNVVAAYAQREAKERLASAIAVQVQRYLHAKFDQWADRIPSAIEKDVEVMVKEVEAQIGDFQLELDRIAALFAGTPSPEHGRQAVPDVRLLQLALSLGDISGMTDDAMSLGDWTGIIMHVVRQSITALVIAAFVPFINVVVVLLIMEAIHVGFQEHEISKRIRQSLGDKLHEKLAAQVTERQAFIHGIVEERFTRFAGSMTEIIRGQIGELRSEQERIIRQRRDERFSVELEKQRLAGILTALQELIGTIEHATFGKDGS